MRLRHRQPVPEHQAMIARCRQRAQRPAGHARGLQALVEGVIHTGMPDPSAVDPAADGAPMIDQHRVSLKPA